VNIKSLLSGSRLPLLLICASGAADVAWGQAADRNERIPTLTVSGSGDVSVDPDRAVVRLGVVAESAEAAAAQDEVNRVMRQVLEAVAQLDVPERAVQTEDLSLTPLYSDFRPRPDQSEPEQPRIIGYRASSVVSVELDDLTKIGGVVDAGIKAGANQLQGISFQLRDSAGARSRALAAAVRDARARAEAIAEAMDVRIDGVSSIVEGDAYQRPPMPLAGARFDMAEMASTQVRPGQVDLSSSVIVTYFVRDGAD
jgi:uncharacterized protein